MSRPTSDTSPIWRLRLLRRLSGKTAMSANLQAWEKVIIMLRFFGDMTRTRIAERIGVSQMHVSRLISRTLEGLRRQLELADQEALSADR